MYIDAAQLPDYRIYVTERGADGVRNIKTFRPPHVFYYTDPDGNFESIYGDKLKRVYTSSFKEFKRELEHRKQTGSTIFESDVDIIFRLLEEKYPGDDLPQLNVGIIDIEADKDPNRPFSRTNNPYSIINALTIYKKHLKQYITLIVPPPNLTVEQTRDLLDARKSQDELGRVIDSPPTDDFGELSEDRGYFICQDEAELLLTFLALIEDIDVLTGWNSTFYDIPYIIQRIRITLGGETVEHLAQEDGSERNPYSPSEQSIPYLEKMNLFPTIPVLKHVENYGSLEKTYKLFGRVHLDYMELYQKFPHQELHSYSLDFVLEHEVKQRKVAYEGSLDQLYRNDIRRFTAYNKQDVAGLNALDDKKKFIDLANTMAHMASVTMEKVLGSVAIIEAAILKRLHKDGKIAFDKREKIKELPVPGAFVVQPLKGNYQYLASYDFNSLYPTTIRLINISPETIIGQFDLTRTKAKWTDLFNGYGGNDTAAPTAWGDFTGVLEYHDLIDETDQMLTLVMEGTGEEITAPAKEWKEILKENNWSISGWGTVFDLSREGIVTTCMTEWYNERVQFKAKASKFGKAQANETDPEKLAELKAQETYYDLIQQSKKLFLNSTYGAYLNEYFRFSDPRLGGSVTLSGRVMTKHMCREACRITTGNYDFDRRTLIAGDTDSCYITMKWYMDQHGIPSDDKSIVALADKLGDQINASMPPFLNNAFLIDHKRGEILEAGREVVGRRGLFKDRKKRYAIHVINKEGKVVDEMKIMGMEIRRSDTPRFIQKFLEECVIAVVKENKTYEEVRKTVDAFRETFRKRPAWTLGSPGRVKKLATNAKLVKSYERDLANGFIGLKKPTLHINMSSAFNTNTLMEMNNETRWGELRDGDKIEVIYLKDNPYEMNSVAIRTGEQYVPEWFKQLPFDYQRMEQKLLDQKLFNVIGDILGWSFEPETNYASEVLETDNDFYS